MSKYLQKSTLYCLMSPELERNDMWIKDAEGSSARWLIAGVKRVKHSDTRRRKCGVINMANEDATCNVKF
jgi:hypothetical protein